MSLINWIPLQKLGDDRGDLAVIEIGKNKNIPFEIKRIYYLFNTKTNVARGFHAHKELKQVAVCLSGRCKMILDNGNTREEVWLDDPTKGLLIESMTWREMYEFSSDCVLLVLASEHYNEDDYIRDYQEFKNFGVNI